jgi:hypothetical protein
MIGRTPSSVQADDGRITRSLVGAGRHGSTSRGIGRMDERGTLRLVDRIAAWFGGATPRATDSDDRWRRLATAAHRARAEDEPVHRLARGDAERWGAVGQAALLPETAALQVAAAAAAGRASAAVARQIIVGIGELLHVQAWFDHESQGIRLDLPVTTDAARVVAGLATEGVGAWVAEEDGRAWATVPVAPWYAAADVEYLVLAVARVAHGLLGLHAHGLHLAHGPHASGAGHTHLPGGRPRMLHDLPVLPARYRGSAPVSAAPMAAAPLVFAPDGRVAWDRMWGADDPGSPFCELALAGGPPHRGTLLEPPDPAQVAADPAGQRRVLAELARGLALVTGRPILTDAAPGWVGLACESEAMALWLLRAILVENVAARREGTTLFLPAGPAFRLEHEIKAVITAVAKTHHYWAEHRAEAAPSPVRAHG